MLRRAVEGFRVVGSYIISDVERGQATFLVNAGVMADARKRTSALVNRVEVRLFRVIRRRLRQVPTD